MKDCTKTVLALSAVFLCFMTSVYAEYNSFGIPDSSEIRTEITDSWFHQDLENIRMNNVQVRKNIEGESFQISLEEQEKQFIVYVSPKSTMQVDVYDSKGVHTVTEDSFLPNSFGSWLYARSKDSGQSLFVRIYISRNSDVYIQFSPSKKNTVADFVIFNSYVAKSVPVGVPFEKILTMSIAQIYSLTKNSLPWKYAECVPEQYEPSLVMIQTIRSMQNKIAYEEDAMYDEFGKSISIRTALPHICDEKNKGKLILSSNGFVKWVVDGLVEPIAGSYLKRSPLIEPTVEYKETGFQGSLNLEYSTNFSLDWTRNIAAAAFSVRANKTYLYKDSGVDVTVEPFAAIITEKGILNSTGYIKNTGYKPDNLKAILYTLSIDEPDYFYLAAIRQTDRKSSEVKVFNDSAVIFPYLDSKGIFRISVFMDGKEIKYSDFEKYLLKSNDCFVHLARVKTSKMFYPQDNKSLY